MIYNSTSVTLTSQNQFSYKDANERAISSLILGASNSAKDVYDEINTQDETKVEVSNYGSGGGSSYKIQHYKFVAEEMEKALTTLATGEDAKDQVPDYIAQMLGADYETGNEFVDAVLSTIHITTDDGSVKRLSFDMPSLHGTSGADIVSVTNEGTVIGGRTGDGADFVQISGEMVIDIQTDSDVTVTAFQMADDKITEVEAAKTYSNSDYLEVAAKIASDLNTGGGDDLLVVSAGYADGVSGGSGNDKVTVQADYATNIDGGTGDDRVTVEAVVAGRITGGEGNDSLTVRATTLSVYDWENHASNTTEARMQSALSTTGEGVQGGAGDDRIIVSTQYGGSVSGGIGNDYIVLSGGTIALNREDGDTGIDVVELHNGVELVIDDVPTEIYEIDNAMLLRFEDGGVIVLEGLDQAQSIAVSDGNGEIDALTFLKAAPSLNARA